MGCPGSGVGLVNEDPGPAALTPSQASALSTNVDQKVIVVLRDQVPGAPASRQSVRTRQSD